MAPGRARRAGGLIRSASKLFVRSAISQPVVRWGSLAAFTAVVVAVVMPGVRSVALALAVVIVVGSLTVGVAREIESSRTLIGKILSRLGIRFVPGLTRFEDQSPQVKRLLDRAWEGHITRSVDALRHLADDESAPSSERHLARVALADWVITHGDPEGALAELESAARNDVRWTRTDRFSLELEAYSLLGRTGTRPAPPRLRRNADLGFFAANLEPVAARLEHLNRLLARRRFVPVSSTSGRLAGLHCPTPPHPIDSTVKVSVIVPAFRAADTIGHAVESLLTQSWRNLEIIVVDDASDDDTVAIVEALADPRIRIHRNHVNSGTYVSRNAGLALATGDYVTVHDADDWCHPQRIATQVSRLLKKPRLVATTTALVRATEDLIFVRRDLTHSQVIGVNTSSLMLRRETLLDVGGWDPLLSAADSELIERLRAIHGPDAVEFIHRQTPLAVTLKSSGSLTASSSTGLASRMSQLGARQLYAAAFATWHRSPDFRHQLPLHRTSDTAPFPAPATLRHRSPNRRFDVAILSSFNLPGGTTSSNLTEVAANERFGLSTALIHNRNLQHRPRPINPKVFAACSERTRLIAQNESIECDVLVIKYPPSIAAIPDLFPNVTVNGEIVIAVNQTPRTGYRGDSQLVYSITECDAEVRRVFGKAPLWAPIGPAVRQALLTHHSTELAGIRLADEDWCEIIDAEAWRRPTHLPDPVRLRIGRHGRDSEWKWPVDPHVFAQAYPDDPSIEVHILGGADEAKKRLGKLPANWLVQQFDAVSPRRFLASLDVFVHMAHPDMEEGFGRTILEALAVGVPVITEPRFATPFGKAVIACSPSDVRHHLERLRTDHAFYADMVARGHDLVADRFSFSAHQRRLVELRSTNDV